MVEQGDTRIIIDAGPDFRQQMLRENVRRIDAIILTHEHKDHIGGIDDVRAFNYTPHYHGPVAIYATERVQGVVRKDFDYAFTEDRYPGAPLIDLITINGIKPFKINDMEIVPIQGSHYRMPVLGFRIGGIAYLTDFNAVAESELEKIKGVEVLIINALRREHHLSHFTLDEAICVSERVCPRRTYFTHISHQMGLHSQTCAELPDNHQLAYDGLVVESCE